MTTQEKLNKISKAWFDNMENQTIKAMVDNLLTQCREEYKEELRRKVEGISKNPRIFSFQVQQYGAIGYNQALSDIIDLLKKI